MDVAPTAPAPALTEGRPVAERALRTAVLASEQPLHDPLRA